MNLIDNEARLSFYTQLPHASPVRRIKNKSGQTPGNDACMLPVSRNVRSRQVIRRNRLAAMPWFECIRRFESQWPVTTSEYLDVVAEVKRCGLENLDI